MYQEVQKLQQQPQQQQQAMAALAEEIRQLKEKLAAKSKDSSTSSKPPSSAIVKPGKDPATLGASPRKGGGQPGHRRHTRAADRLAESLRGAWDQVLERHGIADYVYGPASTFHVYFETDSQRLAGKTSRRELHTSEARLLKGMPGTLINQSQRHLRYRGVDIMSSTGGVLSCTHTKDDIVTATAAFEETVLALHQEGLIRIL
jgi:hypothetical protein